MITLIEFLIDLVVATAAVWGCACVGSRQSPQHRWVCHRPRAAYHRLGHFLRHHGDRVAAMFDRGGK
jgi:hypothetical protein